MKTRNLVYAIAGAIASMQAVTAHEPEGTVGAELQTIGAYLHAHPEMAIDLSAKSGQYCLNTGKRGGGHMTHYAIDPSWSTEDVIDFVKADSLAGVVDVTRLPRAPTVLGEMEPNRWYFMPAGQFDPHHSRPAKVAMLVRAADVVPATWPAGLEVEP